VTDCKGLGRNEVLDQVPGLDYWTLNRWTRAGHVACHYHSGGARPAGPAPADQVFPTGGQGKKACWPAKETEVLRRMVLLTGAGFTASAAAGIARETVRARRWHARRPGVYVLLQGSLPRRAESKLKAAR